jgi:hypothetical protein
MRGPLLLLSMLLAACSDHTQVSASGYGAFEPALAARGDEVIVTWNDNRHGNDEVYLRRLDGKLVPRSDEIRLTTDSTAAYETDVAILGDNVIVAWYQKNAAGDLAVMLGMWNSANTPVWQRTVSAPGVNGRIPVLQTTGERIFLAWIEEGRDSEPAAAAEVTVAPPPIVYGAWFDSAGNMLGERIHVAEASRTTWKLDAAVLPDARVVMAFDSDAVDRNSELFLFLVADGAASGYRLTADDGYASKYPDLAIGAKSSALTWFDNKAGNNEIYLSVFDLTDFLQGKFISGYDHLAVEKTAQRITTTQGNSIGAYVAWNADKLGLAWNDNDPGQHEIHFQAFDAEGHALGQARRLTNTAADSLIPAIVPFGTGFMLGWNEAVLGASHMEGSSDTRSEIVLRYLE